MKLCERDLSGCFPPGEARSVAIIGAGGKTSTLQRLAREDAARGCSVLNLTTTKMYFDQPPGASLNSVNETVSPGEVRYFGTSGMESEEGEPAVRKFLPPSDEDLARILAHPPADRILIEADGARQGWVKIHRHYEPVVPDRVEARLTVLNLRGIGKMPSREWIHRWEDWITSYSPREIFRVGHLEDLTERDPGYRATRGQQRWLLLIGFPEGSPLPKSVAGLRSLLYRFSGEFWFGWDRVGWWVGSDTFEIRPPSSKPSTGA